MQIVIDIPDEMYDSIKLGMRHTDDVAFVMEQIENSTLEQQPCDDCVRREAVIKTISEWFFSKEFHYTNAAEYLRNRLDELPPVTPQPKQ